MFDIGEVKVTSSQLDLLASRMRLNGYELENISANLNKIVVESDSLLEELKKITEILEKNQQINSSHLMIGYLIFTSSICLTIVTIQKWEKKLERDIEQEEEKPIEIHGEEQLMNEAAKIVFKKIKKNWRKIPTFLFFAGAVYTAAKYLIKVN